MAQREVYCVSLQRLLEHEVTPAAAHGPPEHSPPRPAPGSRHCTDRTSVRNKLLRNFLMLPLTRGCCRMLGGWRCCCWGWRQRRDSAATGTGRSKRERGRCTGQGAGGCRGR